jgi:type III pantothenate kinase
MNLVIDRGNSTAKVGIFEGQNMLRKHLFGDDAGLFDFLENISAHHVILSSVSTPAEIIQTKIKYKGNCHHLNHELSLPIKISYTTPATLGVDRIAAVCGAFDKFPGQACLVIDCGTCITYDLLEPDGNFKGGAISPGIEMKSKALNTFTKKLPLVQLADTGITGTSTLTSIQSGIINGTLFEMEGFISTYKYYFSDLKVLLCGGGTSFFENKLKDPIFVTPDLVLYGLNRILLHNVE